MINPEFEWNADDYLFAPYFFPLRVLLALWAGIGLMLFAMMVAKAKTPASSSQGIVEPAK